jgi:hypothetical protein
MLAHGHEEHTPAVTPSVSASPLASVGPTASPEAATQVGTTQASQLVNVPVEVMGVLFLVIMVGFFAWYIYYRNRPAD